MISSNVNGDSIENVSFLSSKRKKKRKEKKNVLCDTDENRERRNKKNNSNFDHRRSKMRREEICSDIDNTIMLNSTNCHSDLNVPADGKTQGTNAEKEVYERLGQSVTGMLTHKDGVSLLLSPVQKKKREQREGVWCELDDIRQNSRKRKRHKSKIGHGSAEVMYKKTENETQHHTTGMLQRIVHQTSNHNGFNSEGASEETSEERQNHFQQRITKEFTDKGVRRNDDAPFENLSSFHHKKKQKKQRNYLSDTDNLPDNAENRRWQFHKKKKKKHNETSLSTTEKLAHKKNEMTIYNIEVPYNTIYQNSNLNKTTIEEVSQETNEERQNCFGQEEFINEGVRKNNNVPLENVSLSFHHKMKWRKKHFSDADNMLDNSETRKRHLSKKKKKSHSTYNHLEQRIAEEFTNEGRHISHENLSSNSCHKKKQKKRKKHLSAIDSMLDTSENGKMQLCKKKDNMLDNSETRKSHLSKKKKKSHLEQRIAEEFTNEGRNISHENLSTNSCHKKQQKKRKKHLSAIDSMLDNSEDGKVQLCNKKNRNFSHSAAEKLASKKNETTCYDIHEAEVQCRTVPQNSDLNKLMSVKASQENNAEKHEYFEERMTEKLACKRHEGKKQHKKKRQKCSSEDMVNKGTQDKINGEPRNQANQKKFEANFMDSNECDAVEPDDNIGDTSDEDECDIYDSGEEILTFDPPLLHFKGHCHPLKAEQRNEIREQGLPVRNGRWSKKEDEILKRNWDMLVKKYKLRKPHLLLGLKVKREPTLMKFIKAKKFYYQLGRDLNDRTIHSIYLRARKLFNPYCNNREISNDCREEIQRLHSIFGNKWSAIGNLVRKDRQTVSEIIRWHQKEKELGSWNKEEEEQLITAIKKVLQTNDITMVEQGIPWEEVATLVPSRNAKQCRAHWTLSLRWKVINPNKIREKWSDHHTVHLIHCLYNSSAENEDDVDWINLYKKFPNVASYSALRSKWGKIKRKVPRFAEKEFEDIVTYLYEITLPVLVKKLGKSSIEEALQSS